MSLGDGFRDSKGAGVEYMQDGLVVDV